MAKIKRGIFFTLDAILASAIIISVLILIYSSYIKEAPTTTINHFSQDLSRVLSVLTVGEVNNSYVQGLINSGDITKLNNTILEQIGEFWAENKIDLAQNLARNVTYSLIPNTFGFGIWVNNDLIYQRDSISNRQSSLISYRRIISGIAKDKPIQSYSSKVVLSGASSRTILNYVYFGGYVGDGTITQYLLLPDNYSGINQAYMEFALSSDFNLAINDISSGSYANAVSDPLRADKYNISPSFYANFKSGINKLKISFTNTSAQFIGGGLFKVSVNSTNVAYLSFQYDLANNLVTKNDYLPGIDGVINLYSSFYIPGNLNSINMFLNYSTNFPLFVSFGNITIYISNSTGPTNINLSNSTIYSNFNDSYQSLSGKTIPLRIGHFAVTKIGDHKRKIDAYVATPVDTSMDTQDVQDSPGLSRLDVTKIQEKNFVDFVINASLENRLGLNPYHSSVEPGQSVDLTINNVTLKSKIDGYFTKSVNTCFSCAIGYARDKLVAQGNPTKRWAIILMGDGVANKCDAIPQSQCTPAAAANEAIKYACNTSKTYNISFYTIAFGAGADNTTLKNISVDCGNGLFFHADNQSQLKKAFEEIADEILSLTFKLQKTVAVGVNSTLYPNSYIQSQYTPDTIPYIFGKLPITIETDTFGNDITSGIINIPQNANVTEALVTSYSSDKWTESIGINSNTVFNLSTYNVSYVEIGDPFLVNIPAKLIQSGNNLIDIKTASGPSTQDISGGSPDDRAIYTILVQNAVSYSSIAGKADGCIWTVKFNDGSNATLKVPSTYSGNNTCDYQNAIYDRNDAIDNAIYVLLSQLDLNHDGLLDVNINQQALSVDTFVLNQIPSLWGPAIMEIRVWQ